MTLEMQIQKALKRDEAFRNELAELLQEAGAKVTGDQTATVIGDGNKTAQAQGSNIKINIVPPRIR